MPSFNKALFLKEPKKISHPSLEKIPNWQDKLMSLARDVLDLPPAAYKALEQDLIRHIGPGANYSSKEALIEALQVIYAHLSSSTTLNNSDKKAIIEKFYEGIGTCTDGFFSRTMELLETFYIPQDMDDFFARMRNAVVAQVARQLPNGDDSHQYNWVHHIANPIYKVRIPNPNDKRRANEIEPLPAGFPQVPQIQAALEKAFKPYEQLPFLFNKIIEDIESLLIAYYGYSKKQVEYRIGEYGKWILFLTKLFEVPLVDKECLIVENDCIVDLNWQAVKKHLFHALRRKNYFTYAPEETKAIEILFCRGEQETYVSNDRDNLSPKEQVAKDAELGIIFDKNGVPNFIDIKSSIPYFFTGFGFDLPQFYELLSHLSLKTRVDLIRSYVEHTLSANLGLDERVIQEMEQITPSEIATKQKKLMPLIEKALAEAQMLKNCIGKGDQPNQIIKINEKINVLLKIQKALGSSDSMILKELILITRIKELDLICEILKQDANLTTALLISYEISIYDLLSFIEVADVEVSNFLFLALKTDKPKYLIFSYLESFERKLDLMLGYVDEKEGRNALLYLLCHSSQHLVAILKLINTLPYENRLAILRQQDIENYNILTTVIKFQSKTKEFAGHMTVLLKQIELLAPEDQLPFFTQVIKDKNENAVEMANPETKILLLKHIFKLPHVMQKKLLKGKTVIMYAQQYCGPAILPLFESLYLLPTEMQRWELLQPGESKNLLMRCKTANLRNLVLNRMNKVLSIEEQVGVFNQKSGDKTFWQTIDIPTQVYFLKYIFKLPSYAQKAILSNHTVISYAFTLCHEAIEPLLNIIKQLPARDRKKMVLGEDLLKRAVNAVNKNHEKAVLELLNTLVLADKIAVFKAQGSAVWELASLDIQLVLLEQINTLSLEEQEALLKKEIVLKQMNTLAVEEQVKIFSQKIHDKAFWPVIGISTQIYFLKYIFKFPHQAQKAILNNHTAISYAFTHSPEAIKPLLNIIKKMPFLQRKQKFIEENILHYAVTKEQQLKVAELLNALTLTQKVAVFKAQGIAVWELAPLDIQLLLLEEIPTLSLAEQQSFLTKDSLNKLMEASTLDKKPLRTLLYKAIAFLPAPLQISAFDNSFCIKADLIREINNASAPFNLAFYQSPPVLNCIKSIQKNKQQPRQEHYELDITLQLVAFRNKAEQLPDSDKANSPRKIAQQLSTDLIERFNAYKKSSRGTEDARNLKAAWSASLNHPDTRSVLMQHRSIKDKLTLLLLCVTGLILLYAPYCFFTKKTGMPWVLTNTDTIKKMNALEEVSKAYVISQ